MALRIAIVGDGKMGRAVAALAAERGHVVHGIIGEAENAAGGALTAERLRGADVAIEFTTPAAAPGNVERLLAAGVPVVTGTTGWDADLARLADRVRATSGALLYASNFSVGVQLFRKTAAELARRFAGRSEFDGFIVEEHHAAKKDAPSGTALSVQADVRSADPSRAFPITSIRAGSIPGTHTVAYDGPFETITLAHVARDRRIFAAGALAAAEWLPGRRGVFTFEHMLFGEETR